MKSLKFVLAPLALALSLPGTAMAHDTQPAIAATSTLLSISAQGRVARAPDVAEFTAGVTSSGKTAAEALASNSADMNRVIGALKKAGIADKDIQTSNINLQPVYAQRRVLPDGQMVPAQPQVIGYTVTNEVSVRQYDLAKFGKVLDTLVAAGSNEINGPRFAIDKPDPVMDEARKVAMKKARTRADLYATAAGLRVVRIVSISENAGYSAPQLKMVNMSYAQAETADEPTPVASGEVSVSVTLNVIFELAP